MKIGVNLIQYTNLGGIEIFAENLINHFPLSSQDELILFVNQKSKNFLKDYPKNTKIIVKNFRRLNKINLLLYQQLRFIKKLKKEKIDLLLCPSLAIPLFFRKKIVVIHDLAFRRFSEESNFLNRVYLNLALWSTKYFSSAIGTISEFSKQEIIKIMKIEPKKITIIPGGCPALPIVTPQQIQTTFKKFNLLDNLNQKKKYFIYIGNTYPRKNLIRIITAFTSLAVECPDYYLVLVGLKNKKTQILENLAMRLKISEKLIFTDFVTNEEKVALLQGATALVIVSLYEGFGLPVLEAQSVGTPVLTSDCSSLPEIAGSGALFVNPQNINEITNGFKQLATNDNLCQKLVDEGQKNIKRYSWEKAANNLISLLKNYENSTN